MNLHTNVKRTFAFVLCGTACLFLVTSVRAAASDPDSIQILDLLSQAKMESIRLREDTNQMQNFVLNEVTWDTHAIYATRIAEDILAMRGKVDQLDMARNSGSIWQKSAIDQINPLITELAATTESVLKTMGQKPFDKTQYNDYLEANYDHAEHLAALISASVDYGKTKVRLQKATEKLQDVQQEK